MWTLTSRRAGGEGERADQRQDRAGLCRDQPESPGDCVNQRAAGRNQPGQRGQYRVVESRRCERERPVLA